MTETTNYHLNQWAKDDRIRMEDFNADNAKLDAALKEQSERIDAAARIALGTYTGTGEGGKDFVKTLEFPIKPQLVIIRTDTTSEYYDFTATRSMKSCKINAGIGTPTRTLDLTWGEKSLSWSCSASDVGATDILNGTERTYYYFLIG